MLSNINYNIKYSLMFEHLIPITPTHSEPYLILLTQPISISSTKQSSSYEANSLQASQITSRLNRARSFISVVTRPLPPLASTLSQINSGPTLISYVSFQVFQLKFCMYSLSLSCVLHVPSTAYFLILVHNPHCPRKWIHGKVKAKSSLCLIN
jgi:hypothetical protein